MLRVRSHEAKGFSRYLEEIALRPILTREQEQTLLLRMRHDPDSARQELVSSHLRLVVKVARRYRHLGLPLDELVAEGNIGLLRAARRFNPARGTRFMTCAIWWIRKSIFDALDRNSCLVRIPEHLLRGLRRAQADRHRCAGRSEAPIDTSTISRRLTRVEIEELLEMKRHPLSLDFQPDDRASSGSLLFRLPDVRTPGPVEVLLHHERRAWVRGAMTRLSGRELTVLQCRYGFDGADSRTLDQTGSRLGISGARVQQIEITARKKLRRYFEASLAPRGASADPRSVAPATPQRSVSRLRLVQPPVLTNP